MIHYGDITQLNGAELPIVDIVTGGSPCQDLSVAGKREGMKKKCPNCDYEADGNTEEKVCPICGAELEFTRSGLFMEQIRVIKELRDYDRQRNGRTGEHIRPRFMVWENVPGAFSSNKGEDFRVVLEETARIADKTATIPRPKNGKWSNSGAIMGDGWSIAWRVHDAQFWGVPQRRRRISLIADFGGGGAPEILFERESVSGDFETCQKQRENVAEDSERDVGETSRAISFQERGGKPGGGKGILIQNERTGALSTLNNPSNPNSGVYVADTTRTLDNNGGNPACNQGGMAVVQTYQNTTGTLSPGAHAGSYNGQDAYNDMLVVDKNAESTRGGENRTHHNL